MAESTKPRRGRSKPPEELASNGRGQDDSESREPQDMAQDVAQQGGDAVFGQRLPAALVFQKPAEVLL